MGASTKTQCKYIDELNLDDEHNRPVLFECSDGTVYKFYRHWDGFDRLYNCQFCKLIGRKQDVFECLNENEWQNCPYYTLKERI